MKRKASWIVWVVLLCLMLGACAPNAKSPVASAQAEAKQAAYQKFSGTFFGSFDTITTVIGYATEQNVFDKNFAMVSDMFAHYHQIFDAYNHYEGVNNLWYVNENAGKGPVKAEQELIDLLLWLKEKQPMTEGRVNVAMGLMLRVWHNYRSVGVALPSMEELTAAAAHSDFDQVIIDQEAGTIHFTDPEMLLDLGAVAKGYTVEIVAQKLLESDMPSFIISAGGNVRCGLHPMDGRARWGVGIQDPELPSMNKDILYLTGLSAVTSGDYQRYYTVDNVNYHHLIDPSTLMPGRYMRAVTVVTEDSGLADMLSTMLFLTPCEEGLQAVNAMDGVEAYWVLNDGSVQYSDGMANYLRSLGASAND